MSKNTDNYLLKKTQVGQVKKGFHELPQEGHTYGKAPQKDKEGARQVLGSWEAGDKTTAKQGGKNYIAMNRQGIKNGCKDSKQISNFHKNNEIKVKIKEGHKPVIGNSYQNDGSIHGIKNRPSTPIKDVICNNYAYNNEQQKKQRDAVIKMINSDKNDRNQASLSKSPKRQKQDKNRKKQIQANNFKLSKFKNVQSKIKPIIQKSK